MALISEIVAKIKVDSSDFKSSLTKSLGAAKSFSKDTSKAMSKIQDRVTYLIKSIQKDLTAAFKFAKKMVTRSALGMAAAFAAVVYQVNKTSQEIDALAKTSDKLGVSIGALQKLHYQSKLAGVSTETLNMAMQRMVRRVGEAANGTGEAQGAIKALGLDAKELTKLKIEDQFYKISEALGKIKNKNQQLATTQKIFDSEGVALVQLFNTNLKETGKEFDSLNVAITKQQAAAIQSFEDSKTKLGTVLTGIKQQLAANLAEPFKVIVNEVTAFIQRLGGAKAVAKALAKFMLTAIKGMITGFKMIISAAKSMFLSLGDGFDFVLDKVDALLNGYDRIIGAMSAINRYNVVRRALGKGDEDEQRMFDAYASIAERKQASVKRKQDRTALKERLLGTPEDVKASSQVFDKILGTLDRMNESVGKQTKVVEQIRPKPKEEQKLTIYISSDGATFGDMPSSVEKVIMKETSKRGY